MVNFCAIIGCGNRSDRDKEVSFYRLPAHITHQGKGTEELLVKSGGRCGYRGSTGLVLRRLVIRVSALGTSWEVKMLVSIFGSSET